MKALSGDTTHTTKASNMTSMSTNQTQELIKKEIKKKEINKRKVINITYKPYDIIHIEDPVYLVRYVKKIYEKLLLIEVISIILNNLIFNTN